MHSPMEEYLVNTEDPLKDQSDDENVKDSEIIKAQEKYNRLHERYVTLKAMTESLRDQIYSEKKEWDRELKETLKMQAEMQKRNTHVCGDGCKNGFNKEEYKKKVELFKDFMFFQHASENLESIMWKNNYQTQLSEVENKCNMELLKIQENMINLKPLQDIASRWESEGEAREKISARGASGDRLTDDAEVPVKETNNVENVEK